MRGDGERIAAALALATVVWAAACDQSPDARCRRGDGVACGVLGDRARKQGDEARACVLYRQACAARHDTGCANLGALLAQRRCDGPPGEARRVLEIACDHDDPSGCNNLGMLFRDGAGGVAPDRARAAAYFRKACRRDGTPCDNLGAMLMTDHDEAGAFAAFQAGCALDGGPAATRCCFKVALSYDNGWGVPADAARAGALYARACDAAIGDACYALALRELRRSDDAGKKIAAEHFRRACDGGVAAGCNNLGLMYATGAGVARDDRRAADLLQRGCDGGELRACANVGSRLVRGDGLAPDGAPGRMLMDRACRGGVAEACLPPAP